MLLSNYGHALWAIDSNKRRVPDSLMKQYKNIFFTSVYKLFKKPDPFEGNDFNNKVKWLMLFDQHKLIITCSDKLKVKRYVARKVGSQYAVKTLCTWQTPKEIRLHELPDNFVLKTNHDSGSVWFITNKTRSDSALMLQQITERFERRAYGKDKGEWCYQHIEKKVFAEEMLGVDGEDIPDFKFHCCSGRVVFVQIITNRLSGKPREIICSREGSELTERLDYTFERGTLPEDFNNWDEMVAVAERLSEPFKYVRVDLYSIPNAVKVGELTFYPRNGNYSGEGQKMLGRKMFVDRESPREAYAGINNMPT